MPKPQNVEYPIIDAYGLQINVKVGINRSKIFTSDEFLNQFLELDAYSFTHPKRIARFLVIKASSLAAEMAADINEGRLTRAAIEATIEYKFVKAVVATELLYILLFSECNFMTRGVLTEEGKEVLIRRFESLLGSRIFDSTYPEVQTWNILVRTIGEDMFKAYLLSGTISPCMVYASDEEDSVKGAFINLGAKLLHNRNNVSLASQTVIDSVFRHPVWSRLLLQGGLGAKEIFL